MDKHTKAIITAYKSLKKDHERLLRLVSDLLDSEVVPEDWASRLAVELSRIEDTSNAESSASVSGFPESQDRLAEGF